MLKKILIAASGTGGHLFPALATAEQLKNCEIEWIGVPDRLETKLVPDKYPLHKINLTGIQTRFNLGSIVLGAKLMIAIWQVRKLLKQGKFDAVFTTGGYIAAPAIVAARSLGLPVILHESNVLPGKVTRWLSGLCTLVALGFSASSKYLPRAQTVWVGTPVREQFFSPIPLDLGIPADVPLIVVLGGSQGAVAVNKLVRECAPDWFASGAWVVHQTGDNDPDLGILQHPQYISLPFYQNIPGLLERANLVISRSGASALTEIAFMGTPSILIPFPFAAEDHQYYNAKIFADAGAAIVDRQSELTSAILAKQVLELLADKNRLEQMGDQAKSLAIPDSALRLANLISAA